MQLRGLAGVLTRTQSLVYSSYKRDRKIQLGGGPETRPGTWEHVSCAFLAGITTTITSASTTPQNCCPERC
eukprot:scaffold501_cov407-Prasinococcus_capsulatus_cf.AAC.5